MLRRNDEENPPEVVSQQNHVIRTYPNRYTLYFSRYFATQTNYRITATACNGMIFSLGGLLFLGGCIEANEKMKYTGMFFALLGLGLQSIALWNENVIYGFRDTNSIKGGSVSEYDRPHF